jgi:hypothetical protein
MPRWRSMQPNYCPSSEHSMRNSAGNFYLGRTMSYHNPGPKSTANTTKWVQSSYAYHVSIYQIYDPGTWLYRRAACVLRENQGKHIFTQGHLYLTVLQWQPKPSLPTAEVFVKECRILPLDFDIMDMRGRYHKERVLELVDRFKVWHEERVPGVRAFQSMYDRCVPDITFHEVRPTHIYRVGITVCKWLYQSLHDVHAISTFDYILPLMVYNIPFCLDKTIIDHHFTARTVPVLWRYVLCLILLPCWHQTFQYTRMTSSFHAQAP